MQILNLSKEDSEAIIRLDATELTTLCNALYYCRKEMVKNETYHKIYGDLTMARNFASYGHIDDFAFNVVEKQRRYLRKIERDRRKGERYNGRFVLHNLGIGVYGDHSNWNWSTIYDILQLQKNQGNGQETYRNVYRSWDYAKTRRG